MSDEPQKQEQEDVTLTHKDVGGKSDLVTEFLKDQEKRAKEKKASLFGQLDTLLATSTTMRREASDVAARGFIETAIDQVAQSSKDKIEAWYKTPGSSLAELQEINQEMAAKLDETENVVRQYLSSLVRMTDKKKTTDEVMAKMEAGRKSVLKLLLEEDYPEVKTVIKWALGVKVDDKEIPQEEAVNTLCEYLEDPNMPQGLKDALWTVVSVILPEEKIENFALAYVKDKPVKRLKEIFDKGSKMGAFSVPLIEKMIKTRTDLNEEQKASLLTDKEKYQTQYIVQHELIVKRAKFLAKESIGAENYMLEAFTGKNILFLIAQLASVMTLTANVMTSMFREGKLELGKGVERLAKNEYVWGAVAILEGIHLSKEKGKPVSGGKAASQAALLELTNVEPDIDNALKDSDFALAYYLSEFIRTNTGKDNQVKEGLTVEQFADFLGKRTDKKEQEEIEELGLKDKAKTLKGKSKDSFERLIAAFHGADIFGGRAMVSQNYKQAIISARKA